jgi:hypothetical protein
MARRSHRASLSQRPTAFTHVGRLDSRFGEHIMRRPHTNLNHGHRSAAIETEVAQLTAAEEQALAEFGHWLDGELDRLVARWIHLAAPNASRRERAARRVP